MSSGVSLLSQSLLLLLLLGLAHPETVVDTTLAPIQTDVQLVTNDGNSTDMDADSLWCPTRGLGSKCPKDTIFYHYNCCGTASDQCCFFINSWTIVSLAIVFLLLVTVMITAILCCVFSNRHEDEK